MKKILVFTVVLMSFFILSISQCFADVTPTLDDYGNVISINGEGNGWRWHNYKYGTRTDSGDCKPDWGVGGSGNYFLPDPIDKADGYFWQRINLTDTGIHEAVTEEQLYFRSNFYFYGELDKDPSEYGRAYVWARDSNSKIIRTWAINTQNWYQIVHGNYTWWNYDIVDAQSKNNYNFIPKETKYLDIYFNSVEDSKTGSRMNVFFDGINLEIRDCELPVVDDITVVDWQPMIYTTELSLDEYFPDRTFEYLSKESPFSLEIKVEFNEYVTCEEGSRLKLNIIDKDGQPVYANLGGYRYGKYLKFAYSPKEGDRLVDYDRIVAVKFDGKIWDTRGGNYYYGTTDENTLPLSRPTETTLYKGIEGVGRPFKLDTSKPEAKIGYIDSSIDTETKYMERYEGITLSHTDEGSPGVLYKYQWINVDTNLIISTDNIARSTTTINAPSGNNRYKLELWVYDMAWNESYTEAIFNQKDNEAPVIEFDYTSSSRDEYKKSHTIDVKVTDLGVGLKDNEIYYLWNDSKLNTPDIDDCSRAPISPANNYVFIPEYGIENTGIKTPEEVTGTYYLHVIAIDSYGNKAQGVSEGFRLDNTGPDISFESNSIVSNEEIPVKVTVTDAYSDEIDEDSLFYQVVQEGDNPESYVDNWELFQNGETIEVYKDITDHYELCVKAKDKLGNLSDINRYLLTFDYQPPEVSFFPETVWLYDGSTRKDVQVSVGVWDNPRYDYYGHAGVDFSKFYYQWCEDTAELDEDAWKLDSRELTERLIESEPGMSGEYYLYVKVSDMLGYTATYKSSFLSSIDYKAPQVEFNPNGTEEYNKSVTVTLKISDYYVSHWIDMDYGWSHSNDTEPSEWQNMNFFNTFGITYETVNFDETYEDGKWYLWVKTKDGLNNEQTFVSEPYYIDTNPPTGSVDFTEDYTNKSANELQLSVDDNSNVEMCFSSDKNTWTSWETFKPLKDWELQIGEEGIQKTYVKYKDVLGNISQTYEAQIYLDKTIPSGSITYSAVEITAENVIATIIPQDDSPVNVLNNDEKAYYIFKKNGEFEFVLKDAAGNIARVKACVNNIDKKPPKATLSFSHPLTEWTNEPIVCSINLVDEQPDTHITSEGGNTHEFVDSGEFTFEFEDCLGNKDTKTVAINNIDISTPQGIIIYSTTETSSSPVTTYLKTNEPVTITNNGGSNRKIFHENGEFTFTFEDKAGNTGEATAKVNNIDSELPSFDITYSVDGWTKENVSVEYLVDEDNLQIINPETYTTTGGIYVHTFNENGTFTVIAKYVDGPLKGQTCSAIGAVYNIDRIPPTADVVYSTTEWTENTPVTATLMPLDDKSSNVKILNNEGKAVYSFYENDEFTFKFEDEAGNEATKTVKVDNIITDAPIPNLTYSTTNSTNEPVVATLSFDNDYPVEIINNNGEDTFTFVTNGEYTFKYLYGDGNEGSVTAVVENIISNVRDAEINYYFSGSDEPLNESDMSMLTSKDIIARISFKDSDTPCNVINNDGKDSYIFEKNGYFKFIYEDETGQRGEIVASVSNIDKIGPKAEINLSTENPTRYDIKVEISIDKLVTIIGKELLDSIYNYTETKNEFNQIESISYYMHENGTCSFKVQDESGNISDIEAKVSNIDRDLPIGKIIYSTTDPTNGSVVATLTANENIIVTNLDKSKNHTFDENGSYIFRFKDIAGNESLVVAKVDNIDKVAPNVSVIYSTMRPTNQPVEVTLVANEEIKVNNNNRQTSRIFYKNGSYTFEVEDLAGNGITVEAEVNNIDIICPQIILNGDEIITISFGGTYDELGAMAVDDISGDLTEQISINGEVNTSVAGDYIVTYSVSDDVGNITSVNRNVRIVSIDNLALFLNGKLVEGEITSSSTSEMYLKYFGSEGITRLKWVNGWKDEGYFKANGNILIDSKIDALNPGWYTIYFQDQERNTKIMHVYYRGE